MKIGIFGFNNLSSGKENIIDQRLDKIKQMVNSAKKVYIQAELLTDFDRLKECDGIISTKDKQIDLILTDLEFVEKRLVNSQEEKEKNLLSRFKEQLEKEQCISALTLTKEENGIASNYSLLSFRPIFIVQQQDLENQSEVLSSAYNYFGYISFFTANEKESRAWSIKKGTTCWEASGLIHSDIQKGFIRAEVIGFNDLINNGGISQARANNHLHLENKDYIVQDGDLIKFRFSK